MEPLVFAAATSNNVEVSTIVFSTMLLFLCVLTTVAVWKRGHRKSAIFVAFIFLCVAVGAYARVPRQFVVTSDAVIVRCLGPDETIPVHDITGIARIDRSTLNGSARYGIVTVIGDIRVGEFQNDALGRYHAYITSNDNFVLLETVSRMYVLSPDDSDRFVDAVESMRGAE